MNRDTSTPSAHRAVPTLEWESLRIVGAPERRDRHRLLVAALLLLVVAAVAVALVAAR